MNEIMTWEQMKRKFKNEWVLIEDPETTEMLEITGGKVLYHGRDKEEVERVALELRPRYSAVWYTGKLTIPKGTVIIL